jgi:signal transduction histidine kinase
VRVGWLPGCDGDPLLLKQVWTNLIGNALKYTGGREQAQIEIGFEAATSAYFVRDNGAGFDMQHAAKLFGVFERLHREDEFEGTGLGLAIVERIIRRHGGRIWAEAQPGKGAKFTFTVNRAGSAVLPAAE